MKANLSKVTLRLREGDTDYIIDNFPETPMTQVIRHMVSGFVDRHRKEIKKIDIKEVEV